MKGRLCCTTTVEMHVLASGREPRRRMSQSYAGASLEHGADAAGKQSRLAGAPRAQALLWLYIWSLRCRTPASASACIATT